MHLKNLLSTVTLLIVLFSCSSDDAENQNHAGDSESHEAVYFPPINSDDWETKSVSSLGWNQSKIPDLLNYLQTKN